MGLDDASTLRHSADPATQPALAHDRLQPGGPVRIRVASLCLAPCFLPLGAGDRPTHATPRAPAHSSSAAQVGAPGLPPSGVAATLPSANAAPAGAPRGVTPPGSGVLACREAATWSSPRLVRTETAPTCAVARYPTLAVGADGRAFVAGNGGIRCMRSCRLSDPPVAARAHFRALADAYDLHQLLEEDQR